MEKFREFVSRRNSVSLINYQSGLAVKKVFATEADAKAEASVYALVEKSPLNTAKAIAKTENELILTSLPGQNFVEVLERQEAKGVENFAPWEALADWLYDFHRFTGLIMADMNLRNFIFDEKTGLVSGLDFEQCRKGDFEEMAAGLCAYTLLYSPEMSAFKKSLSEHMQGYFVEKHGCNIDCLKSHTDTCVLQIRSMRKAKHGVKAE